MAERDCPKCPFSPMESVSLQGGMVVDECPRCRGRWYDFNELAKIVANRPAFEALVAKGALRPHPGKALCPVCSEEMVNGGLGSEFLRVDQCPGHGFWLEANEIRLLDKLLAS